MAEGRKPTIGSTVAPPDEKSDFLTQLQNTFERGVVSAEVDLTGLFNDKGGGGSVKTMFGEADRISTGPQGVHDQIFKRMKEIANASGGKFAAHAPLTANPSDLFGISRAEAMTTLKKSLEYVDKLGATHVTIHPLGQMEYYFTDPFVGTKIPVQNPFFLCKDNNEFDELAKKLGVKDEILKNQLRREWTNFVGILPMSFAEKFGPLALREHDEFSADVSFWRLGDILRKNGKDADKVEKEIRSMEHNLHPSIFRGMMEGLGLFRQGRLGELVDEKQIEFHKDRADRKWVRVAMSSLDPITNKGEVWTASREYTELDDKYNRGKINQSEMKTYDRLWDEKVKFETEARLGAWAKVVDSKLGGTRFGPFEDAQELMIQNLADSFDRIFGSIESEKSRLFTSLKNRKIRIGIENLFPASPERGYMQGYAYFYSPEHIAKAIKEIRKVAEKHGIPPEIITTTFDVAHAASAKLATGLNPSEFIEKLKKEGIKVEYSHLVGGTGYGHGHIAWGDWLDEVSRMDPGVIEKLMNVGAINIEGGAGLYDTEVTLNTLWDRGLPLEAIMAMAGGPSASLDWGGYSGFSATPYNRDMLSGYAGSSMPLRSFYSFQEGVVPSPMKDAFGSYTMPARFGGGYSHGPGRTSSFWVSSQPLLYSSKSGGGEET